MTGEFKAAFATLCTSTWTWLTLIVRRSPVAILPLTLRPLGAMGGFFLAVQDFPSLRCVGFWHTEGECYAHGSFPAGPWSMMSYAFGTLYHSALVLIGTFDSHVCKLTC